MQVHIWSLVSSVVDTYDNGVHDRCSLPLPAVMACGVHGDDTAVDVDHVGPDGLLAHRLDGQCGDERAWQPPWRALLRSGDLARRGGETADESRAHHQRR